MANITILMDDDSTRLRLTSLLTAHTLTTSKTKLPLLLGTTTCDILIFDPDDIPAKAARGYSSHLYIAELPEELRKNTLFVSLPTRPPLPPRREPKDKTKPLKKRRPKKVNGQFVHAQEHNETAHIILLKQNDLGPKLPGKVAKLLAKHQRILK